ncbi:hypothetical protein Acr_25g0003970 [Actinidia rufa]|uniref:Uncharacterized protein n=1 Tax=Actinidia rufa TaxID=165716 RepID=A0A7J0GZ22_9ERIC|nr:hypothetical protein Acr_25g0003970 [Actinidia rufa]
MSSNLAKLRLSAVLAYGLFDAVAYTSFFVLAFLRYEKSTGNNPATNLQALDSDQSEWKSTQFKLTTPAFSCWISYAAVDFGSHYFAFAIWRGLADPSVGRLSQNHVYLM